MEERVAFKIHPCLRFRVGSVQGGPYFTLAWFEKGTLRAFVEIRPYPK